MPKHASSTPPPRADGDARLVRRVPFAMAVALEVALELRLRPRGAVAVEEPSRRPPRRRS
jgi:hypothetical protein